MSLKRTDSTAVSRGGDQTDSLVTNLPFMRLQKELAFNV